ncbi:MAG: hypothetical protein EPN33_07370 [Acidobacteria bacterium]|nr:MAG: hypothetical protein EPN33_07370 [Acidobacteriota bacterium]
MRPAAATTQVNKLRPEDSALHDWYRFVLSYPPHLVRNYAERFSLGSGATVLDPFCGTGTTLVECKLRGIGSVGVEANPMAAFASRTKLDWDIDAGGLSDHADAVAEAAASRLAAQGLGDGQDLPLFRSGRPLTGAPLLALPEESNAILLTNSISPVPLHRLLTLLAVLREQHDPAFVAHERLALAKIAVFGASNLSFGPEIGLGKIRRDAPAVALWRAAVAQMAADLRGLPPERTASSLLQADSRQLPRMLSAESIDAVITSPPYPNEKDYTRTTRLESVLLGFLNSRQQLRSLKQDLLRSNTRGVYIGDRDDQLVAHNQAIQKIAAQIEKRRIELGKTSGFEKLYARVTQLYFGGMTRHFAELRAALRPGAQLAYVVGDQASYLQVMIRTGQLLADVADSLGYEVVGLDLFRTRLATATREQLREEAVILRWPGPKSRRMRGSMNTKNAYTAIIEHLFHDKFKPGDRHIDFRREELAEAASALNLDLPKNLGDLVYSFRYRTALPASIQQHAGAGEAWLIRPAGRARYRFVLARDNPIAPNRALSTTKIPDATPGVVAKYALSDEQALLAKVRYNRLIDIFTGVACYSLQSHLRTAVPDIGQVETDEIYIGIDKRGRQYVLPVQAKGGNDKLSVVQIEQDLAICAHKFPSLICRAIAAQFMAEGEIALFEFEESDDGVTVTEERHYRLVPPEELSDADLAVYRARAES